MIISLRKVGKIALFGWKKLSLNLDAIALRRLRLVVRFHSSAPFPIYRVKAIDQYLLLHKVGKMVGKIK